MRECDTCAMYGALRAMKVQMNESKDKGKGHTTCSRVYICLSLSVRASGCIIVTNIVMMDRHAAEQSRAVLHW